MPELIRLKQQQKFGGYFWMIETEKEFEYLCWLI
jgi:hypothetical protein